MPDKYMAIRKAKVLPKIERRNLIIASIVLAIMISSMAYYFAFPRTSVDMEIWYQEGWMGSLNIDLTVRNNAPSQLDDFTVTMTLVNDTGINVSTRTYALGSVQPWADTSLQSMAISGLEMGNNTHFDTFTIILETSFTKGGDILEYNFSHTTEEPYLNIIYRDHIGGVI